MKLLQELQEIPEKVAWTLKQSEKVKKIAEKYQDDRDFLFLGRGYNFPVALEGALKLKEISYIHAEGYPAAEMKHGPIALVDETLPVVFVATKDPYHQKVLSNMQEIKARKGIVIAVISETDTEARPLCDDVMIVPEADEILAPRVVAAARSLLGPDVRLELTGAVICDESRPFFTWHNRVEGQHAGHVMEELEETYFDPDFDREKFFKGGREMLDGVAVFWDGLEQDRVNKVTT